MARERYIIKLLQYDRYLGCGYLQFSWKHGTKYPLCVSKGSYACTMNAKQKDYICELLTNNGALYEVIPVR